MRFAEGTIDNEETHHKLIKKKSTAGKGLTASLLKMQKTRNIMQIFKKYIHHRSNGSDDITREQGLLALKDLGLLGLSSADINAVFNKANGNKKNPSVTLSIQMFIPFAGIDIVLNKMHWPSDDDLPHHLHQIQEGLMEIVLIFREIDADDSGEIDASELRTALCNTAGMSSQNELTNARFAEMDIDSDKTVSITEFVRAFLFWSGSFEEDDDDDADE
ncbi:conserved hypothetical protein [Perkinsus marinus ATCC 50983]|uniref:EF-hand domain-containing protein n=1 Tax=Perkinsus marinus (strain ATCC 50983 / TXsc) TaxID=423536 RepID=C5LX33_PERM5|nr:conserved hypothetical protein [Perkinsus marinus ATCC 50983]EEQ98709.1 conserved hypothetical protein [Perkinsus marinus ATCC 50983]|eukprot:XP_002765992.1 conserved hypothetical protein [Perkinsus marinus ATCC 50983]